ncbi:hypothetical protein [Peribacillus sp. RS7]|uniref:hypothetical protein n=1 Tax=Peribacillus sp. RS7 TaxID=3242679 RepID=UPI0035BEEAF9
MSFGNTRAAFIRAALKMLDLSPGKVVTIHDSSLGFRNGPISIVNELFISQD